MTDRRREREEQGSEAPKPDARRCAEKPDATGISAATPISPSLSAPVTSDPERDRRIRRARFLADLAEARELRRRVAPRRARAAELHARVLRTFRY
jgi:hypothetical protein